MELTALAVLLKIILKYILAMVVHRLLIGTPLAFNNGEKRR